MTDAGASGPDWGGEAFEDEEEDGLAAERTELAWGRSSLSLMVCGVAVARGITRASGRPLVGLALLVFGAIAWVVGLPYARTRALAMRTGERHVMTARELAPLAIGTAAIGVSGLLIELLLPA